jgi:hypothetical protein
MRSARTLRSDDDRGSALISLAGVAGMISVLGIRFTKIGPDGPTLEASVTQATVAEAKRQTGRDFAPSAAAAIRAETIAPEDAAWDQLPDWAKQALQSWANSGQTVVTRPLRAAVVEAEKAGQGDNPWFVSINVDDGTMQVFRVATGRCDTRSGKRWWLFLLGIVAFGGAVGWLVYAAVTASGGVKWTDVLSSASSLFLLTTVVVALFQLQSTRKAGQARWAIETRSSWDKELVDVRHKVAEYGKTPEALRAKVEALWRDNDPQYYELLRELDYWDRVAYLVKSTELSPEALYLLAGPDPAFRWSLWQPTVDTFLRKERGFSTAYDQFEWLATCVSKRFLEDYLGVQPGLPNEEYRGPR